RSQADDRDRSARTARVLRHAVGDRSRWHAARAAPRGEALSAESGARDGRVLGLAGLLGSGLLDGVAVARARVLLEPLDERGLLPHEVGILAAEGAVRRRPAGGRGAA